MTEFKWASCDRYLWIIQLIINFYALQQYNHNTINRKHFKALTDPHSRSSPPPPPHNCRSIASDPDDNKVQRQHPILGNRFWPDSRPATSFVDPQWLQFLLFPFSHPSIPCVQRATYFRHCKILMDLADDDMPQEEIVRTCKRRAAQLKNYQIFFASKWFDQAGSCLNVNKLSI